RDTPTTDIDSLSPTRRSSDLLLLLGMHSRMHPSEATPRMLKRLFARLAWWISGLQRMGSSSRTGASFSPTGTNTVEAGGRSRGVDRKSTRLNSSHVKISYAVF